MEKKRVESFEDLEVNQKLEQLHVEVHALTFTFPKHEMYGVGSQVRRSSNAIPANLAEGWNNKHINVYLEGINRSLGELREASIISRCRSKRDTSLKKNSITLSRGMMNVEEC